jgi:hypothetical protein
VGVLRAELAAAHRAARKGAQRVAVGSALHRGCRDVVEGKLQLFELDGHGR